MKIYNLDVKGYYLDDSRRNFPEASGVYFVYRCQYGPSSNTVLLKELLYVGETNNLHERHNDHNRRADFLREINTGETLCYSYSITEFSEGDRKNIEAALIYRLQPRLNLQGRLTFDYEETMIRLGGNALGFIPNIILVR